MNRTQTSLSRLGIFSGIEINVYPDTTSADRLLDVDIACTFDAPLETSLEVNVTSKSNSYLGPGLTFGLTNRNLFGGGEQLSLNLTGSYEWQTGRDRGNSIFNSYEVGLTTSLSFPRLLAPRFVPRSRGAKSTGHAYRSTPICSTARTISAWRSSTLRSTTTGASTDMHPTHSHSTRSPIPN